MGQEDNSSNRSDRSILGNSRAPCIFGLERHEVFYVADSQSDARLIIKDANT